MDKGLLEFNKDTLCKLSELDKSKVYLFEFEAGDAPNDVVINRLRAFKTIINDFGIEGIISIMRNGVGEFKVTELKKYLEAEDN